MADTRRKTMHDVARIAGVSYQTVSRVINNHPAVSAQARERVLAAIEALDYRPNRAAQSLAGRHTRTLGMTVFGLDFYGPSQMVISIENAARDAGYDLILANVRSTNLSQMEDALHHLRNWDLDGFLLVMPLTGVDYDALRPLCGSKPTVLIGADPGADMPSVAIDQRLGARLGAEHLLSLGHRQIAEVSGPRHWVDANTRHTALVESLQMAGLALRGSEVGDWTARDGFLATRRLLSGDAAFTALVAGNDQMALGAIWALHEAGLRVPEDVAVIGFDDVPEAAYFHPPLTTVRQEFEQLGRMGMEYLINLIKGGESGTPQRLIAPRLIARASTLR